MTFSDTGFLTCPIHQNASLIPDETAIRAGTFQISYKELDRRIGSVAIQLHKKGVKKGTPVALLLDTSIEYVILLFALFRLNAIAATINTRVPTETVPELLQRICCSLLISEKAPEREGVEEINHLSLQELQWEESTSKPVGNSKIATSEPATIIFSSGSTGVPKAVLHSFGNHYYSALGSNQNIPIQRGDQWLLSLPLYHVAGIAILFRTFLAGATVVILDKKLSIGDNLLNLRVTHASLVSTQLQQVLKATSAGREYPGLKALLVGGSKVDTTIRIEARKASLPVFFLMGYLRWHHK